MPFDLEIPLSDLWHMALVQLGEAQERLSVSEELLAEPVWARRNPDPKRLLPPDDDLVFA